MPVSVPFAVLWEDVDVNVWMVDGWMCGWWMGLGGDPD